MSPQVQAGTEIALTPPQSASELPTPKADRERLSTRLIVNLTLLVGLGVAILIWFETFSDLLPAIVGLLGLGGILAWIGFVSHLITKETQEEIQAAFESSLLGWRSRIIWLTVLLAVVVAPAFGSLVVDTLQDGEQRTIEIVPVVEHEQKHAQSGEIESAPSVDLLEAHGLHRFLRPTWLPWFSRSYWVKVSGLPGRVVALRGFSLTPLRVPKDFPFSPGAVIHASAPLTTTLEEDEDATLIVSTGTTHQSSISHYRGETVWVGYEDDVEVPDWLLAHWKSQLEGDNISTNFLAFWKRTRSVSVVSRMVGRSLLVTLKETARDGTKAENTFSGTVAEPYPSQIELR